jgi:hypothetical protein
LIVSAILHAGAMIVLGIMTFGSQAPRDELSFLVALVNDVEPAEDRKSPAAEVHVEPPMQPSPRDVPEPVGTSPGPAADRSPGPTDKPKARFEPLLSAAAGFVSTAASHLTDRSGGEEGQSDEDWTGWDDAGTGGQGAGGVRPVEFFGVQTEGERVVYVVDASGSMRGERFQRARDQLLYSIENLGELQEFAVFFFNDHRHTEKFPTDGELAYATAENKELLREWVKDVGPQGRTHPTVTMRRALRLRPEVVFFLSDGEIPENTVRVAGLDNNDGQAAIHTFCFQSHEGAALLIQMAEENDGEYRYIE